MYGQLEGDCSASGSALTGKCSHDLLCLLPQAPGGLRTTQHIWEDLPSRTRNTGLKSPTSFGHPVWDRQLVASEDSQHQSQKLPGDADGAGTIDHTCRVHPGL